MEKPGNPPEMTHHDISREITRLSETIGEVFEMNPETYLRLDWIHREVTADGYDDQELIIYRDSVHQVAIGQSGRGGKVFVNRESVERMVGDINRYQK